MLLINHNENFRRVSRGQRGDVQLPGSANRAQGISDELKSFSAPIMKETPIGNSKDPKKIWNELIT
jgi:hypothetical protein